MDLLASAASNILFDDSPVKSSRAKRPRPPIGDSSVDSLHSTSSSRRINPRRDTSYDRQYTPLRRWCMLEFFYSSLDEAYFSENEFVQCLECLGLRHVNRLPRSQWSIVRGIMGTEIGRPRRFSSAFLAGERDKLREYRQEVRYFQRTNAQDLEAVQVNIPPSIAVGDSVAVYDKSSHCILKGTILSVVSSMDCTVSANYLVQFNSPEIESAFYKDIDISLISQDQAASGQANSSSTFAPSGHHGQQLGTTGAGGAGGGGAGGGGSSGSALARKISESDFVTYGGKPVSGSVFGGDLHGGLGLGMGLGMGPMGLGHSLVRKESSTSQISQFSFSSLLSFNDMDEAASAAGVYGGGGGGGGGGGFGTGGAWVQLGESATMSQPTSQSIFSSSFGSGIGPGGAGSLQPQLSQTSDVSFFKLPVQQLVLRRCKQQVEEAMNRYTSQANDTLESCLAEMKLSNSSSSSGSSSNGHSNSSSSSVSGSGSGSGSDGLLSATVDVTKLLAASPQIRRLLVRCLCCMHVMKHDLGTIDWQGASTDCIMLALSAVVCSDTESGKPVNQDLLLSLTMCLSGLLRSV